MNTLELSEELQDMLTEVFHIGVGRAAASLSEMLEQNIDMDVPELFFLNHSDFEKVISQFTGNYVCVLQSIHGDLEGMGSLSFPLLEGKTLVDNLVEASTPEQEFGAMETEAIEEVGNIIINGVGAAFHNVIGLQIDFEPPKVLFLDAPIPLLSPPNNKKSFFTFAKASLKAKESNISGFLNMMIAYNNIDILDRLIKKGEDLSTKFGEMLIQADLITSEQLAQGLEYQRRSNQFIGEWLIDQGYITAEQRDVIIQSEDYQQYTKKFGEALLEKNYITPQQLSDILNSQKLSRNFLGEILVALGFLNEDHRNQILEKQKLLKQENEVL